MLHVAGCDTRSIDPMLFLSQSLQVMSGTDACALYAGQLLAVNQVG